MERTFFLPDLGEGLEEAEVLRWLVAEGEAVALNQPLAEIETAKATVEIPSPFSGTLRKLQAQEGATVKVGSPLATFEVERGAEAGAGEARRATPAARRRAKELGVDLRTVTGTGRGGRITPADVESTARAPGDSAAADVKAVPLGAIRRAIAANLTEGASVPQVTTFRTVDCLHLEALRREIRGSPLPIVVKALAQTCRSHPVLNSSWGGEQILFHRRVDVGIATDTDRGLLVPVVRDAGAAGISAIAAEIARLAEAARRGTLAPADTAAPTIAVTNTGSYGSEYGTPLLLPGTAVTLALGVIQPRALVVGGEIVARPACTLSLTFDHRVLDGATAGRAVGDLVDTLEDAERLGSLPR